MVRAHTLEDRYLLEARHLLFGASGGFDERDDALEGAASLLGGFCLATYRRTFRRNRYLTVKESLERGDTLLGVLATTPIAPSLALCSLGRPHLNSFERRTSGAYHTDYRLANFVADSVASEVTNRTSVIDPAAGTGILLASVGQLAHKKLRDFPRWLAQCAIAWDLSEEALAGARVAMASLVDDIGVIRSMSENWACHDSLAVSDSMYGSFDIVVGNPPWERLKATRHEFLQASGVDRHYGEDYGAINQRRYNSERGRLARYGSSLTERFEFMGRGEPDLYKAFLDLSLSLLKPRGILSVLVPAGLIRSQGTELIRHRLLEASDELSVTVMENRKSYFAIDTRFKFLRVRLTKSRRGVKNPVIQLSHGDANNVTVHEHSVTRLSRESLLRARPDLSIPEVRGRAEWMMYRHMAEIGRCAQTDGHWDYDIVREVDMTRDKFQFSSRHWKGHVPVIEGRMVHQYRFGAKAYRSGRGRAAIWEPLPFGSTEVTPQYWFPLSALRKDLLERSATRRAGFCDVTGQTNERTALVAAIPPGVICGNKVPTVIFSDDPSELRLFLWIAILNSLPFDWALRRTITTTLNYFVLRSVPLPKIHPNTALGRKLARMAIRLDGMAQGHIRWEPWVAANLRAQIDVEILLGYGLDFQALEVMFNDFPLLDRGQPALPGEDSSTVTRDLVLDSAARRFGLKRTRYASRVERARAIGAYAYVPSSVQALATFDDEVIADE